MTQSTTDTPTITPVDRPNWLSALASCLLILPLGLVLTYTPVFLQDPANSSTFTTVVLQTALLAGLTFRLAAWSYRRITQHSLPLQAVLAGAFLSAIMYVVVFYGAGAVLLFVRGAGGDNVEVFSDALLWFEAGLAWLIAQLLGFRQAFTPLRPAESRMAQASTRPHPVARIAMLALIAITLLSLLAVIIMFQ